MNDAGIDHTTRALIATATPWIDDCLARHSVTRSGPLEHPRVRSWATVIAVPTSGGTAWFKAASSTTAHEIGLYPILVAEAPGLVLHPYATDPERAWMLLPDGGTSLLHSLSGDAQVHRLVRVLPHYAQLQRAMMRHVPAMLALGVPDMRPNVLPARFDEALAAAESIAQALGSGSDIEALRRVATLRPRFVEWCESLAASPIPASIDHSDLHANNLLLPDGPDGPARIYDWGDSVIALPFSTLLVMLRALMDSLETTPEDPRISRVRDAYLEAFTDLASHEELISLADAACWTSVVSRAIIWVRVLEIGPPANPAWSIAPLEWMKTFLNTSWLE